MKKLLRRYIETGRAGCKTVNRKSSKNKMKRILLCLAVIFVAGPAFGQERVLPKRIKARGEYRHAVTQTVFPERIGTLERLDIYSFNKENTDIGVSYGSAPEKGNRTILSVFISPAGRAVEGRLRYEYAKTLGSLAMVSPAGMEVIQIPARYAGKQYICNGYKAYGTTDAGRQIRLMLFECGNWFFKVRLTTGDLDAAQVDRLERTVLDRFDPSGLTALSPLRPEAVLDFAPAAFADSLMLLSATQGAYAQGLWCAGHVEPDEMASGYPDLYLDLHIAALQGFARAETDKGQQGMSRTPRTQSYLDELRMIVDSGFLAEFVMEQFDMIMLVPPGRTFDFEGYEKWKSDKALTVNLHERFYVFSLEE